MQSTRPSLQVSSTLASSEKGILKPVAGHKLGTHAYKGEIALKLAGTNGGRFTPIGGGLPVKNISGQVLGAIGVSTGTPEQDQEVAQAGLDALNEVLLNTFYAKSKL